jgi:tetratricopeptide (TPR) repeat protein
MRLVLCILVFFLILQERLCAQKTTNDAKFVAFQKLSKAAFLVQKEQFEQALVILEEVHQLDTTLSASWFYKGKAQFNLKNCKGAVNSLLRFIEMQEKQTSAIQVKELALLSASKEMLVECWVEDNAFAKALPFCDSLLAQNPENTTMRFARAKCYLALGQKNAACQDFQKAAALGHQAAYAWEKKYCKE